jgi:hypothetical protein
MTPAICREAKCKRRSKFGLVAGKIKAPCLVNSRYSVDHWCICHIDESGSSGNVDLRFIKFA